MDVKKVITLKPEEELLSIVHESSCAYLLKFGFLGVWVILPFFFLFPLMRGGVPGFVLFLCLLLPGLYFLARTYKKWSGTALVITDKRIIDINQKHLFERKVSEVHYRHVEDVIYRVKGVVPTLCKYGDLRMKIVGERADIVFHRVRRPERVKNLIQDLRKVSKGKPITPKEKKLQKIAETLSEEEIEHLTKKARRKEQHNAAKEMFEE
jgi:hypothetical protein